jgi:hypothetical protein
VLQEVDDKTGGELFRRFIAARYVHAGYRKRFSFTLVGIFIWTLSVALLIRTSIPRHSAAHTWLLDALLIFYVTSLLLLMRWSLKATVTQLFEHVFLLCYRVDRRPRKWLHARRRSNVVVALESCAKIVERLPLDAFLGSDTATRGAFALRTTGIAAHVRQLKLKVIFYEDTTPLELATEISGWLPSLMKGRWYDMPSAEVTGGKRLNLSKRIGWSMVFLVLFAGLLGLGALQSKLGVAGNIGASVVAIILISVLTRLGVTITSLQQAADAASTIVPKCDK